MQYINPIEILGLSGLTDTTSIDNEIVRKAKRKLFADIDLSDNGLFQYYGLQLTKGDCEKAIDELTNNDLKEFYLYLASNKKLNTFLVNGDDEVFNNFKLDSIFKLPEFVKFISPYFAPKFDKTLLIAFENENIDLTKAVLNTSFLIAQSDVNTAFKSVSNSIQNKISEINEITKGIKNEESNYDEDDIEEVVLLVKEYFPTNTLNCLPQYFQSQILKIANTINFLQLSIWDAFDNTQVPNDLLEYILTLNIGGLDKPTFEKNYEIVRKKNHERIEQGTNAPILKKYAGYLIQTKTKTTTPNSLLFWIDNTISISDINNLAKVFDEIKNQVALSLRAMSVEVWNSFSNIEISIDLINKANSITGLKAETQQYIQDAKTQLTELKSKINASNLLDIQIPLSQTTNTTTAPSKSNDNDSGCFVTIIIFAVVGFVLWFVFPSNKSYPTDNSRTTDSYSADTTTKEIEYSNDNSNSTLPTTKNEYSQPKESKYKGNRLKDGASPLTSCFGEAIYGGNATLTIKNGGNADAIICLYSASYDKTIRNEYVRKNSSFTMSKIAQGEYKIRVFYGNDWNPDLENSCGTKGNFESDVNFSEFDGTEYFQDSEGQYTTATITLYTVAGGNASSSAIDQSRFFSK